MESAICTSGEEDDDMSQATKDSVQQTNFSVLRAMMRRKRDDPVRLRVQVIKVW